MHESTVAIKRNQQNALPGLPAIGGLAGCNGYATSDLTILRIYCTYVPAFAVITCLLACLRPRLHAAPRKAGACTRHGKKEFIRKHDFPNTYRFTGTYYARSVVLIII